MTVALIYGGKSSEHEISLMSATAVARHINKKYSIVLIAITKDGKWFLQNNTELERILENEKAILKISELEENKIYIEPGNGMYSLSTSTNKLRIDVMFPVLHGCYGEDGTIQGLFEMIDIPYVGCNVVASSITMDKEKTKAIISKYGINVVPYITIRRTDLFDSSKYDEIIKSAIDTLHFPLFVKPCSAGSSVGASKATNEKELAIALMSAFHWDDKVLIEKAVTAREIECSVMGNSTTSSPDNNSEVVKVFGPGEIILTHKFYDYDAKYKDSDSVQIPADLDKDTSSKIRELAIKSYKAVDAAGLSRIDFFIEKDTNTIYLNEINSMPGFTEISMFSKLCDNEGLDFDNLVDTLIEQAILRYKSHSALKTSIM